MKKMFVVLAATLICSACFLTSCKKDKKNDDTPTPVNNNVYEVNLTAIVHECSTPYLMINLEYTDADGVNHTEVVKGTDQTETILPKALEYYQHALETRQRVLGPDHPDTLELQKLIDEIKEEKAE